jgi:hypothetical protein
VDTPGLITEFLPVVIRRAGGEMTDDEMRSRLEGTTRRLKDQARRGGQTVTIVDLTQASLPNEIQQNMHSVWLAQHEDLLKQVNLGTAFVVASQQVRGGLSTVLWQVFPQHDYTVTTSLDEAIEWAIQKLRDHGIEPPERLVAEGARAVLALEG